MAAMSLAVLVVFASAAGVAAADSLTSGDMCFDWTSAEDTDIGPGHFEAYMFPCNSGAHQMWSVTSWGGLTTDGQKCLDYTHNTYGDNLHHVYMSQCDSGAGNQKWTVEDERVKSGGLCLEWTSDTHDSGKHAAYLTACGDQDHQKISWSSGITEVFPHGWGGSKCYRIPTILRMSTGTLVAFSEARLDGCDDGGNHDLVSRRSTDDGRTWGELIIVTKGVNRPKHALSNPNPVEVTLSSGQHAVLLLFDSQNNPKASNHGDTYQTWSYDDGKTWHDSSIISGLEQEGFSGCMPGPSLGIQEESGTIFFVCHTYYHAFLAWSTDLGKTWQHSQTVDGIDECSVAALPNDNIAMNCKSHCGRSQLTWSPAGELLSNSCIANLQDPGCQGSMIFWQSALYLSNDNSGGRDHLTVRRSQDEGKTWDAGVVVEYGKSGYSQLVGFPGQQNILGVLYENDFGIAFKLVNVSSLESILI
jgi:sialidase-1